MVSCWKSLEELINDMEKAGEPEDFIIGLTMSVVTDDHVWFFNDDYVGPIDLPKGATNLCTAFSGKKIKEGCYLRDFDTSCVRNMSCMFDGCVIPKGFMPGPCFDTRNVSDMYAMFRNCVIPEDFAAKFVIAAKGEVNVARMFTGATLPPGYNSYHYTRKIPRNRRRYYYSD